MTFSRLIVFLYVILLCITGAAKLFQGDGSDEPGFVPPPARKDVNNLLKELKKQCDVDWDWEARYLSEVYISPLPGGERTTKGKTDANKTK